MKKLLFILILFCSIQGFGQSTNGAKGYWRLNGNSSDYSGGAFNGTDTNISYSQSNGILHQGAGFDGTTSKILLPLIGVSGSSARTLYAWVYRTSNSLITVYSQGTNAAGSSFVVYCNGVSTGDVYVAFNDGDFYTATGVVPINKWTLITVTYSGTGLSTTSVKVYVDTIQKTTTKAGSRTSAANTANSNYCIGWDAPSSLSSRYWSGAIDEVILINAADNQIKIKNYWIFSSTKFSF